MSVLERTNSQETLWTRHIQAVDRALAHQDTRAAVQAWDDAHLAAMGDGHWQGLIEVGEAYLRVGTASGTRKAAEATARKAYFAALFRACQKESFEGIVRTAEAFADLGDRQVVEECVALADLMADNAPARARVHTLVTLVAQLPERPPAPTTGAGLAVAGAVPPLR